MSKEQEKIAELKALALSAEQGAIAATKEILRVADIKSLNDVILVAKMLDALLQNVDERQLALDAAEDKYNDMLQTAADIKAEEEKENADESAE